MKAKLRSPLVYIPLLLGGLLWATSTYSGFGLATAQVTSPPPVADTRPGAEVVAECRKTLENHSSIEVELSQVVSIYGQQLNGKGEYLQQGQGGTKTRLVLNFSGGGQNASFRQINDGRFVYTKVESPQTRYLSQVDLLKAERELGFRPIACSPSDIDGMTVGAGLLALLRMLEQDFEFIDADLVEVGGQQVWQVEGRWTQESLTTYFDLPKDAWSNIKHLEMLPEYIPTHVQLEVGVDPQLPYFPYQVTFLRIEASDRGRILTPLSNMEINGIRQGTTTDADFEFVPGEDEVVDKTREFVRQRENRLSK
jgi:hypothetical protein